MKLGWEPQIWQLEAAIRSKNPPGPSNFVKFRGFPVKSETKQTHKTSVAAWGHTRVSRILAGDHGKIVFFFFPADVIFTNEYPLFILVFMAKITW